ncbi:hypothetical protein BFW01_g4776 [Lasiodiplodia theobromae]|nr:hypothetical protein BFW01_g4776 [Lasiodiplodia theobromae]
MDYNEDAMNHHRPSASEAQKRSDNVVVTVESFQRSQAEWLAARQLALLQPVEAIPLPPLRPLPTSEFVWPVMSIEEFSARVDALRMNRSVEKRQESVTEPAGGFQSKKPSTTSVEHERQMDEKMDAMRRDIDRIDRMLAEKAHKPSETAESSQSKKPSALSVEQQRQMDESIETLRQDFKRALSENVPEPLEPLPPVPTWLDEEITEMADLNQRFDEANRRRKARSAEKRQENVAEPARPAGLTELLESSQSEKPSTLSPERQRQLDEFMQTERRKFDDDVLARIRPKPLGPLPPLPTWPEERMREVADLTQRLRDATLRHQERNRNARSGGPSGESASNEEREQSPP